MEANELAPIHLDPSDAVWVTDGMDIPLYLPTPVDASSAVPAASVELTMSATDIEPAIPAEAGVYALFLACIVLAIKRPLPGSLALCGCALLVALPYMHDLLSDDADHRTPLEAAASLGDLMDILSIASFAGYLLVSLGILIVALRRTRRDYVPANEQATVS